MAGRADTHLRERAIGQVALNSLREWDKVSPSVTSLTIEKVSKERGQKGFTKHDVIRVVLPVRTVIEIFANYSYDVYSDKYCISAPLEALSCKDVWRLKQGDVEATSLRNMAVNRKFEYKDEAGKINVRETLHCQIKQLEPRLDYETWMQRFQFAPVALPKILAKEKARAAHREKVDDYMRSWQNYIVTEKKRQMNISERELWPQFLPWDIVDVMTMPMVVWLRHA